MNPLIRLIPAPLVRIFARPYVAGDSLDSGMEVARRVYGRSQLLTTLDLLAEGDLTEAHAAENETAYRDMIAAVAAATGEFYPRDLPTVSLKPSSYTAAPLEGGGDAAGSREAIFRLVEQAADAGVQVSIDMESRHWTDFTLDVIRDLHGAGHDHVGAVLQTRLNRTRADLDVLPSGCRVRLVIGIYREPAEVATTDKHEMKQRMLDYAKVLLERGHYVEFATHDDGIIHRFVEEVVPAAGVGPDRFEVQMLYGVPRTKTLRRLAAQGIRRRLYVPYALGWSQAIRYLRRRLDEYPVMMFLVAKNLLFRR